MATIKTYTDLEQSKKLAEILPLKSADMKWFFWKSEIDAPKVPTFGYSRTAAESYKDTEAVYLPCWSLAALLDVLSKGYSLGRRRNGNYYVCMTYINHLISDFDNPVDACVEIIEKLHELKKL